MPNKIKYGLSNVHYAVGTPQTNGSMTYVTPVAIPGAVNLSLPPQGDNVKLYADDIDYWVGNGNNGYSGDLEIAIVPDYFRKDVLKEIEDSKGVLVEDADSEIIHFALLFQFKGDVKARKYVMYNCTCGRPNVEGSTKGESIEPKTDSLPITVGTIYNASLNTNIVKACTKDDTDSTTYNGWNSAVYIPTAATTETTT